MPESLRIRPAAAGDAEGITTIFNQGIADRVATFETSPATVADTVGRIESGELCIVAERGGTLAGFARVAPYSDPHPYYAGVGEATLYVERAARREGVARALMEALGPAAEERGFYKLVGKIFTSNEASIAMVHACGWRDVGVHLLHGRLDGEWKDVLVVELLLPAAG